MKVYTKIVYDKDDNIIEEHSYNYNGPVSQAKKSYEQQMKEKIITCPHCSENVVFKRSLPSL